MKRLIRSFVVFFFAVLIFPMLLSAGGQSAGPILREKGEGRVLKRANGETFPTRQIELIVPVAAGGGQDLISRQVAAMMTKILGVPVVVNNMPGGNNLRGIGYVLNTPPDGYTLMSTILPGPVISQLTQNPGFTVKDLTPIILFAKEANMLVAHKNVPYNTFPELIKAYQSGKYDTIGSTGFGSTDYLCGLLLRDRNGLAFTEVLCYNGSGELSAALLREEVPVGVLPSASIINLAAEGEIKPIMFLSKDRLSTFPNVPAYTADYGYESIDAIGGQARAFMASPKLPTDIQKFLHEVIKDVIKDPEFVAWAKEKSIPLLDTSIADLQKAFDEAYDIPKIVPLEQLMQ